MKTNLVDRFKNIFKSNSSSEDSGAETIKIDDTGPHETVSASDVLHDSHQVKGRIPLSGKVYILDLKPFLDVVGVGKSSRLTRMLNSFSRNVLERNIGAKGAISSQGDNLFFFRFAGKNNQDGWRQAVEIVDEIGTHFLRDAYKPAEFVATILAAVDAEDAVGADGQFDADKIMAASTSRKTGQESDRKDEDPGDAQWQAFDGRDPDAAPINEWQVTGREKRPARIYLKRQSERRSGKTKRITGREHRKILHGRRDTDNPKKSVW